MHAAAKQLCIRWQSGKCIRGANCAVIHASAYPISAGTVCMSKRHNSMNHVNTSYLPDGTNSSDASHSLTPSASKVQSSSPFGCLQPWVQPLLCMHRNGLLKPMRMGSFLLRHILLFRLSLLSLGRSCTWHQISHQPFRLHQLLISLHQHAFSLLSNMRFAANEGGSTSSVMPVQGIALQGGSSSAIPQVLQNCATHGQRPLVVPPRDITNTTVVSTSQLHITASRDVSRLCVTLRGPRPRQSPVLSSRLTQRRRGIGISDAR